jgi:hypothetical protein
MPHSDMRDVRASCTANLVVLLLDARGTHGFIPGSALVAPSVGVR